MPEDNGLLFFRSAAFFDAGVNALKIACCCVPVSVSGGMVKIAMDEGIYLWKNVASTQVEVDPYFFFYGAITRHNSRFVSVTMPAWGKNWVVVLE